MDVRGGLKAVATALVMGLGLAAATGAKAQTGAEFFKDKTVVYIVATAAGGGYDVYGRLTAEFMQKYLPGSTFVVRNLPGAGHLVGSNTLAASKPDGLTIGTFNTGLIYNQLIKLEGMRYNMAELSWIGKVAADPRVIAIAVQSPIKSVADLRAQKEPVLFATAGPGSAAYVEMSVLLKALGVPHRLLSGYDGNENAMAMRRGEVVGNIGSLSSWEEFRKQGIVRIISQIGGSKDSGIPQLKDEVSDPKVASMIALVESQGDISRFTAGPPKIPADRLEALRDAFRRAMQDKDLIARVEKLDRPFAPAVGEDVASMIKRALDQTPETIALLKEGLAAPGKEGKKEK
jgi:tripartite-type tricarboxylate transporter receptor subunit TctC